LVVIHPSEQKRIKELGGEVKKGFLQAGLNRKCPFKTVGGLCNIHKEKPFGCKASPFTLNHKGMLIIRNRYRCLICYNTPNAEPAYISHRWSLGQIFGEEVANTVATMAERGVNKIPAIMDMDKYNMLVENDRAKHNETGQNTR